MTKTKCVQHCIAAAWKSCRADGFGIGQEGLLLVYGTVSGFGLKHETKCVLSCVAAACFKLSGLGIRVLMSSKLAQTRE